mgnify:CR=1 FL=1
MMGLDSQGRVCIKSPGLLGYQQKYDNLISLTLTIWQFYDR